MSSGSYIGADTSDNLKYWSILVVSRSRYQTGLVVAKIRSYSYNRQQMNDDSYQMSIRLVLVLESNFQLCSYLVMKVLEKNGISPLSVYS